MVLYFVAIIYAHWVQDLIKFAQRSSRMQEKYLKKK